MRAKTVGVSLWLLACAAFPACGAETIAPFVVWDVTFDGQRLDAAPAGLSKEQREAFSAKGDLSWLPLRAVSQLLHVTRTRQAKVVRAAAGLADTPLLFTFTENAEPQYGPQVWLNVPYELAMKAAKWRLSLDVAKGDVSISGGVTAWDVFSLLFHEDGTLRANGVQIARYAAGKPLHVDGLIDVSEKTVTVTVDGDPSTRTTLRWYQPKATRFASLRLDGLLPGGHGETPSSIAFDNIRLVLAETR